MCPASGAHHTYYHHGTDKKVGKRPPGEAVAELEVDEVGVWMEAQPKLRDEYEQAIWEMVKAGKLDLSSGTAAHLVERKKVGEAHEITRWPLGLDASLTPTPAEPRTSAVSVKSLLDEDGAEADPPEKEALPLSETEQRVREADRDETAHVTQETKDMGSPGELTMEDHTAAVRAAVQGWTDRMNAIRELRAAKAGRVMSARNRQRLSEMSEMVERAVAMMREMLEETEPDAEAKALLASCRAAVIGAEATVGRASLEIPHTWQQ
ncbi:MAG: hypothetical protein HY321_14430 [Armatimonadetes bacterium]|nr:hypothetical protein [Armatimonadota bacterium]